MIKDERRRTADGHDGVACYLATAALLLEMAIWRQWWALEQMRRAALGLDVD